MKKDRFIYVLALLLSFVISLNGYSAEQGISILSKKALCLKPNDKFTLEAQLGERAKNIDKVYWVVSDPSVVSIDSQTDNSVVIKALKQGKCEVKMYADRRQIASCAVIVDNDGVVRVLAIGNSFSEDALEEFFYQVVHSEGIEVIVGNLYIPGCSLERHWQNASENQSAYSYRKIVEGTKTTTDKVSLAKAIEDEDWDFISFQQASHFSGIYSTYESFITPLFQYVKANNKSDHTQYVLHQTWAYAGDSKHDGFRYYNNSQMKMYENIVQAIDRTSSSAGINIVVPTGTAIQNGRTSFVGDNFCRDGYHLDLVVGRYTASCTWAKELLGLDVLDSSYAPAKLTPNEVLAARLSAHYAVLKPLEVTDLNF